MPVIPEPRTPPPNDKGPVLPDLHLQIEAAGERRRQALAMADSALHDIVDLLPEALAAGLSKQEIAQLAGVSRLTLDAVMRRRRDEQQFHALSNAQLGEIQKLADQLH